MYEKESDIRNVFFGRVDDELLDDELPEEDSSPSIPDPPDDSAAETEEELPETSGVTWTRGPNGRLIRT